MSTTPFKIGYGAGTQQFAELFLPPGSGPFPVVLLIHGGFWRAAYDLSLMTPLAQDLVGRGYAVWNIEYRRVGNPGGGWPGTFIDVAQATDFLTTLAPLHHLDLQRIIAIGHSAGGHLALWLAARRRLLASEITVGRDPLPIRGVISLAGANDLEHVWRLHLSKDAAIELLGGDPTTYPLRYQLASPAAQLPLGLPQILIHGDQDANVPLVISQDYAKRAEQAGDTVKLVTLPGADHFVLIDPHSGVWQLVLHELAELLGKTA